MFDTADSWLVRFEVRVSFGVGFGAVSELEESEGDYI